MLTYEHTENMISEGATSVNAEGTPADDIIAAHAELEAAITVAEDRTAPATDGEEM
jgi:hypothetical protein